MIDDDDVCPTCTRFHAHHEERGPAKSLWWILLVFVMIGWMIVLVGCSVTPADKAFVEASRVYYDRTNSSAVAAIRSNSALLDVEKQGLLGLVSDYGVAVEENEVRVGLKKRGP